MPASADVERYLDSLWMERGLSENTLSAYRRDLTLFSEWLDQQGAQSLLTADASQIQSYLGLKLRQGASPRSSARFLSAARSFYRWSLREGRIVDDPTLRIESPKQGRPLPKSLSEADVDQLLSTPDLELPLEFRDRTMLEILYACGLRVSELVSLRVEQVGLNQGIVRVLGKGGKERLVPMGEEALDWLTQYMRGPRSELLKGQPSNVLFPSNRSREMTRQTFWYRIKIYAKRAGI